MSSVTDISKLDEALSIMKDTFKLFVSQKDVLDLGADLHPLKRAAQVAEEHSSSRDSANGLDNHPDFEKDGMISSETMVELMKFVEKSRIGYAMLTKLNELVSRLKAEFKIDDAERSEGTGLDTIYNAESIKNSNLDLLTLLARDLILFGYCVIGIRKDVIGWALSSTFPYVKAFHDGDPMSSPLAKNVTKKNANRLAQGRGPHTTANLLPYIRMDLEDGDLRLYTHVTSGEKVYMWIPKTKTTKRLENNFRTVVFTMKGSEPNRNGIQTGLPNLKEAYIQYRIDKADFHRASSHNSHPTLVMGPRKTTRSIDDMSADEQGAELAQATREVEITDQETADDFRHMQGVGSTETKELLLRFYHQDAGGDHAMGELTVINQMKPQLDAISNQHKQNTRSSAASSIAELPIIALAQMSMEELDKYVFDAYDRPVNIGTRRKRYVLSGAPGLEPHTFVPATPNPQAVAESKQEWFLQYSELFSILNKPTNLLSTASSRPATNGQISAQQDEQMHSESSVLRIYTTTFDKIYSEWGARLDSLGLIQVIKEIQEQIKAMRIADIIKDYLDTRLNQQSIVTVDDILAYFADPETRNSVGETVAAQISGVDINAKRANLENAKKAIGLAMDKFKNWSNVLAIRSYIENVQQLLYRSLSSGMNQTLRLYFSYNPSKQYTLTTSESSSPAAPGGGDGGQSPNRVLPNAPPVDSSGQPLEDK